MRLGLAALTLSILAETACLTQSELPLSPSASPLLSPRPTPSTAEVPGPSFAYAAADGTIWLINADGAGKSQLISAPIGSNFDQARENAKWSPDGQSLAYLEPYTLTGSITDAGSLRLLDASTGLERQIDEEVSYFKWAPEGRYLFYQTGQAPWIADTDSGSKWQLPQEAAWAAWSPDGTRLAYSVHYQVLGDWHHRARLYLINIDGSSPNQLTDDGVLMAQPWSPDGRFLAYWKNEEGGSAAVGDIYVMEISTGKETGLGHFTGDEHPQWAPDETQLVFHNLRIDPKTGTTEELFPRPGSLVASGPASQAWSPDGRKVALVEGHPFGDPPRSLVILDLATARRTQLHTSTASLSHAGSPGYFGTWSPDGRYFAFNAIENSDSSATPLYVADVSSAKVNLVLGSADVTQVFAAYSPDGTRLLIQNGRYVPTETGVLPSILIANADGSGATKLADGVAIGLTGWQP
ncbi:MAG TPA: hypothetical protein VFT91_00045 [Dehalococcoidia bacterium]|nr:hypothetical protein [Dehalococcoidia bacterium]